ncbi:MAG: helix-turn-helix transcriptional regulator [Candidatus Aminicenantes bacterium]|nr:helix-turn-helix transcriptional regulator [Candidatus Aminicenantes bacterium]
MKEKRISDQAIHFILSRKNEELKDLTGLEIARNIGTNQAELSRSFKIDYNITLSVFVKREKIYRALSILDRDHEKSIDELAKELGFLKVEDFIMEFRRQAAIEPQKYRELRKKAKPAKQA